MNRNAFLVGSKTAAPPEPLDERRGERGLCRGSGGGEDDRREGAERRCVRRDGGDEDAERRGACSEQGAYDREARGRADGARCRWSPAARPNAAAAK